LDISVGFTIKVKAVDFVGNWNESSGKYDGPFREAYDLAVSMLTAAWNALCKVAEKVVEALNTLVSWIWDAITAMFSPIINAINTAIESYVRGVGNALTDAFDDYRNTGEISDTTVDSMGRALFGSFYDIIKPLIAAMEWVMNLIKPFIDIVSGIVDTVTDFVGDIIKSAFGAAGPGGEFGDVFSASISGDWGAIFDAAIGLTGLGTAAEISFAITVISALVTILGFWLAGLGVLPGIALVLSVVGIVIGAYSFVAPSAGVEAGLMLLSIGFSGGGIAAALLSLLNLQPGPHYLLIGLLAFIAIVLGAVGIVFSIAAIVELNDQLEGSETSSESGAV